MNDRLRKLLIVAVGSMLTGMAMTADAAGAELERKWRQYQRDAAQTAPSMRFPHASCFRAAALAYRLPETLLLAVARGESDFDASARSRANAHGVMQILWPTTARHLGIHRLSQLYDPCTNIDAGARYLRELLQLYDNNLHLALAAYNYGPGRIAKNGQRVPSGAVWYSGYIYRHLDYVLGARGGSRVTAESLYSEIGQSTLLTFGEPYRAAAFVASLEAGADGLQLDWFRRGTGKFEVVMTYADRAEFDASVQQLAAAGFRLPR